MTPPIFQLCSQATAVTALLGSGANLRLYSFGEAPENVAKPYAVWQIVNGNPENYLAGRPDADGVTLQVDVYGVTGTSVRAVRDAIRDAIELQANVARWGGEARDPTTKNYRTSFDVDWIVQR
ncbi:DUF3168 domain-containing protein [Pseudomonas juntendi]|jgi:hypothetical protein|uniref:DUF3168 domain-containing protein n=1 Tax=Pseudomonas juntendi TaxID=2666183 RepID=UPI0018E693CD|nr:DUF3168 domain-containing protein [Pseudomonas juntendi]MBI6916545.1 DUF3168 domain-containing protein [Pseudomonas juntendi]MDG9809738.1 DUF3168 domain-containing protein [Pseudomonas juntendi]